MKIKTGYTDSKRLFIAITLPADFRVLLFKTIKDLARQDLAIRPVAPECIHLTLKFLGRTDLLKLREIMAAINDTAEAINSFSFTLGTIIGAFPEILSARILFAPVEDTSGQIANLFNVLENNLAKIKIKKEERKFTPHITIARIKENLNICTADLIKKISLNFKGSVACSKITLFE
ncbi:MAG TPA: RNA 2',3'-cyclic phosphodiesterase, partial [Candidatus Humimicrobiaceae bacterium]